MSKFPDATSDFVNSGKTTDIDGNHFTAGDRPGYVLYQHDIIGNCVQTDLVNYIYTQYTEGTYIVDTFGLVTQVTTGFE